MDKELQEAKIDAMERHLKRLEKRSAFKITYKTEEMGDYIDFYINRLDTISDNYIDYIQTRERKHLNRMKEAQELLSETATEALLDVGS